MSSQSGMRIGIDLGGSKIEAIAIDADGAELTRRRIATPAEDYAKILAAVADLVSTLETELGRNGSVGIATPGAVSRRTGLMKNSNTVVLNGRPLPDDLAQLLRRPVRIENDANCLALSEAVDGAAAEADVVFGVILGTGVGGGIVVGKRVLGGRNSIAGEWGHNPFPWAGPNEQPARSCYCGKTGCIETYLSGPAFARDYRAAAGKAMSAPQIARAAADGDPVAEAYLRAYADRLARAIASVINVLDPDAIVLGGGLSNIASLYRMLPPLIENYAFSDGVDTPILAATHGDSSGVRGAAWLWPIAAKS